MSCLEVPEVIYVNNWPHKLTELLSRNAFGNVYRARTATAANSVIKIERPGVQPSQIENEWKIYGHLRDIPGIRLPSDFGEVNGLKFLLMKPAGQSLQRVFERLGYRLPSHKPFETAIALIDIVEHIHNRGIVHRDIKPDNIMIPGSRGFKPHLIDVARIALVDFGLSAFYTNTPPTVDGDQSPGEIAGTTLFASIHTHRGHRPRPRDDLESISYVLVYLLRSSLPWQHLQKGRRNAEWSVVMEEKISISSAELAKDLPGHEQVAELVEYSRNLREDQLPDYQYIRDLLSQAIKGIKNSSSLPDELP